jgi:hypothetical protein
MFNYIVQSLVSGCGERNSAGGPAHPVCAVSCALRYRYCNLVPK